MSLNPDDFDLAAFMAQVEQEAADTDADVPSTVTQEDLDKQIPRIKKLLHLAENASNPAEADAFNAKANAIIAKYGVDALMLAADEPDKPRTVGDRWVRIEPPYVDYRGMLLNAVARVLGGQTVYLDDGAYRSYHLFGTDADLLRIEVLFASLATQMDRELGREVSRVRAQGPQRTTYSQNFMTGYIVTVRDRLIAAENAARRNAEQERGERAGTAGTSVALAIVERGALVARRVSETYPNLTKAAAQKQRRGPGMSAGIAAGERANLTGGTDLSGPAARPAIGR